MLRNAASDAQRGAANRVTTFTINSRIDCRAAFDGRTPVCHRALAEVLERLAQTDDAEALVLHWGLAGNPGAPRSTRRQPRSKPRPRSRFERAARLYELALETHDDATSHPTGRDACCGGSRRAGRSALPAAAKYVTGEEAAELRRKAAHELLCSGNFHAAWKCWMR